MTKHVFFSFHYENDIWRIGQVRNVWVTRGNEDAGYWDAAKWEEIKRKGDEAIRRWIDNNMKGNSVTVVLIGRETAKRKWVKYEIMKTKENGKALLGIYIHNIKNREGKIDEKGENPFKILNLSGIPVYDWVNNDGYNNIGNWIDNAYKKNYKKNDGFWSWFK